MLRALAALILMTAHAASGQVEPPRRPALAHRVAAQFDFEQRDANTLNLPINWIRAQHDPEVPRFRPGFPIWNQGELDYSVAASGDGSVVLPTNGGSTSLRLEPGVVPVFPGTDYLVSARVRTEGLVYARASIRARFLDASGEPIPGSETHAQPMRSEGAWKDISVEIWGRFDNAAFLQIDLEVLQEKQTGLLPDGPFRVWREDRGARAWFDDVTVVLLPRVTLTTDAPANLFMDPEVPELTFGVRDLTGERLAASIELLDIHARVVDQIDMPITGGLMERRWVPAIDRYGWYRAVVTLHADDLTVWTTSVGLAYLPPSSPITGVQHRAGEARQLARDGGRAPGSFERIRFAIDVSSLNEIVLRQLHDILYRVGAGSVALPIWDAGLTLESIDARINELAPLVHTLLDDRRRVTLSLQTVPLQLAENAGQDPYDPARVIAAAPEASKPFLDPYLDRFGQRVRRWRVSPIDALDTTEPPIDLVRPLFTSLVPGPVVLRPGPTSNDRVERWPDGSSDDETSWLEPIVADATEIVVAFMPDRNANPAARTARLARRAINTWAQYADQQLAPLTFTLADPWFLTGPRGSVLAPEPELPLWRGLAERLADRRVVARLPTEPGVVAAILAPTPNAPASRGGALVVWREPGAPADPIELFLGEGNVRLVDLFCNETPLPPIDVPDPIGGTPRLVHRIYPETTPVFVEGIDTPLARFIAAVRIEPPFLPTTSQRHEIELIVDNPWPQSVIGTVYLVEPGGLDPETGTPSRSWRITPRSAPISIPPEQERSVPFDIGFSRYETAGRHDFVIDFELNRPGVPRLLRVHAPFSIGLSTIDLALSTKQRADGALVVEAAITNVGDEPLTAEVAATAPGNPKGRALVGSLPPGQTARRVFTFSNTEPLRNERVYVSVHDIDSGGRVTNYVTAD